MSRARRALLIGEFSGGALGLAYERALAARGWSTVRYDSWARYARSPLLRAARPVRRLLRPLLWRRMRAECLALADRERPELILTVKGAFLDVAAARALRSHAAGASAMIYPDSPYGAWTQRRDAVVPLRAFDRVYIWGRFLVPRLEADGVRTVAYLPFAHDPSDYPGDLAAPPRAACGRRHPVVFVGQHHPKRETWLRALADLDVGVWGTGWATSGLARVPGLCLHDQAVRGREVGALYASARVALNVLNPQNVPAHNMRTFEIPPCGTLMVTEGTPEIETFFPAGRACLTAADPAALRRQVERGLADPALAGRVAAEGRATGRLHTYAARVETLLADLGLAAPAGTRC